MSGQNTFTAEHNSLFTAEDISSLGTNAAALAPLNNHAGDRWPEDGSDIDVGDDDDEDDDGDDENEFGSLDGSRIEAGGDTFEGDPELENAEHLADDEDIYSHADDDDNTEMDEGSEASNLPEDASTAAADSEAAWDESTEEENEDEAVPLHACVYCGQDEEHDPGEDFEAYMECAGCGANCALSSPYSIWPTAMIL